MTHVLRNNEGICMHEYLHKLLVHKLKAGYFGTDLELRSGIELIKNNR
jgi:hypothetical protein